VTSFNLNDLFNDPTDYKVWDNEPGGTVVKRWTEDGVKYVGVEFENSPGIIYTYLA
jgi:hypothetical protein